MPVVMNAGVLLERLRIAPPGSFNEVDSLLGRSVWRAIPAGSLVDALDAPAA